MQSGSCDLEVKNIGHLGLVAAVFKELKLVERIDEILPKTSKNVKVSHGQALMAMVMPRPWLFKQ